MSTVVRACVLVVAGAVIGVGANAARKDGVKMASFAPATQCTGAGAHAAAEVLLPAQATSLCGQADVVIADTRQAAAYAEGHVAGAIHLPCDSRGQTAVEALARFDKAHTILVYGASTEDARPVAESLAERHPGVRVALLGGGFAAWQAAGLACASGACEECKASNP